MYILALARSTELPPTFKVWEVSHNEVSPGLLIKFDPCCIMSGNNMRDVAFANSVSVSVLAGRVLET